LVSVAAEEIPDLERRIQQQENFISTLLGNNPGPIARGIEDVRFFVEIQRLSEPL
jgi:outer membrane protein, multidrug efflux system